MSEIVWYLSYSEQLTSLNIILSLYSGFSSDRINLLPFTNLPAHLAGWVGGQVAVVTVFHP